MSIKNAYSRFLHGDTNILSAFAKRKELWRPLQDFLHSNDLCLAFSGAQAAELNSAPWLHEPLNTLLTAVPSALIKSADIILQEEIDAHPNSRTGTLLQYPLNALLGKSDFGQFLSSRNLTDARAQQRSAAQEWMLKLEALRSNFPPTKSGKYDRSQADLFAWTLTVQELGASHFEFLQHFKDEVSLLKADVFRSLRITGYVIYYKYYLAGQKPKESDFGDMFQLYDLPYCKLAIMERNISGILNQIKKNHNVLDDVTVVNMEFLADWKWIEDV
jgi:hypothetical protein